MPKMHEPELGESALRVLKARYLLEKDGGARETPGELFIRVASGVARAERPGERKKWEAMFLELMISRRFLPNSPTLMNAGRPAGQLSACFVLPVEDTLAGIFESLRDAALIHQSGGGTGFSFSRLRPRGSRVQSSQGQASGPVSFIRVFDAATDSIKQGGTRRGANMGILRVDHPDILEFVEAKKDFQTLLNFNLSVGITDEFMTAAENGAKFGLRHPASRKVVSEINAGELFEKIVDSAWRCGDPGLVFLDRVAKFNPTPNEGEMESTNPCGEQPLLPYESCNLGSLNLGMYREAGGVAWERLRADVWCATRFLDDVISVNHYPVRPTADITARNRKIGLGVMGFADLLLLLGVPYTSPSAVALGERIMSFIDREAKRCSAALAIERGAFPNFRGSLWQRLGYPPLRNATVSTVAPTGTISLIAGASSGIEPIFSALLVRNVLDGARLVDVHPAVMLALEARGKTLDWNGGKATDEELSRLLGAAWSPAPVVPVETHVRVQAAFQRHSDSAVSKTINLPEGADRSQVRRAYRLAFLLGCKGITVYRDRSRPTQVLERGNADVSACPVC